ncbi:ubiquitin-like small modifier protein 1 [Halobellus inordinatus]|uniref:ubiquitin-like small modifier protein 1 n=1 Tax=Halobellus inordinatus TaxID=1126236 RepID=UPI0021143BF2|nr:ubiquitin-like small modifier protein 1 [Halobellus ramosii]
MDVTVYGPLRSATGDKHVQIEFEGGTVRDAIEALVAAYPRAKAQMYRNDGRVAPSVRISVDGDSADVDDPCPADASLAVHPAVQGG